jgi:hypothetical protein
MPKPQQSWDRSQHPPTQWNLRGAPDEAVLNNVYKKKKSKKSPFNDNQQLSKNDVPPPPPPPLSTYRQQNQDILLSLYLPCIRYPLLLLSHICTEPFPLILYCPLPSLICHFSALPLFLHFLLPSPPPPAWPALMNVVPLRIKSYPLPVLPQRCTYTSLYSTYIASCMYCYKTVLLPPHIASPKLLPSTMPHLCTAPLCCPVIKTQSFNHVFLNIISSMLFINL